MWFREATSSAANIMQLYSIENQRSPSLVSIGAAAEIERELLAAHLGKTYVKVNNKQKPSYGTQTRKMNSIKTSFRASSMVKS